MVLGGWKKGGDNRGQSERASEKGVSLFEEDRAHEQRRGRASAISIGRRAVARRASREKPKRRVWLRSRRRARDADQISDLSDQPPRL